MIEIIKRYIQKNLFYLSVIITGMTSLFLGIFYTLFKANIFENVSNDFLTGTGVLGSYVTKATFRFPYVNYFVIGLIISLLFFFMVFLILHLFLKEEYLKIFNLLSFLNIILIVGLILACLLINISDVFSFIILISFVILYLLVLNKTFDEIFNISLKQRIMSLVIIACLIIVILILLKLFV